MAWICAILSASLAIRLYPANLAQQLSGAQSCQPSPAPNSP